MQAAHPAARRPRGLWIAVCLLCFCSGAAGLTYEVIWLRVLAAALGNAAHATAAVLAAVMAGMGLGALYVGQVADRHHPLRLYGIVEVALGLLAIAVPIVMPSTSELGAPLLRAAGTGIAAGGLRFVIASLVVLVPSCLLGASIPVLVRFGQVTAAEDRIGRDTAVVYALNTLGAALGCALTGYFLLGTVGIRRTSLYAGLLDVAVGLSALVLARTRSNPSPQPLSPQGRGAPWAPGRLVVLLAALSGFCLLGLETLWTRFLRIVMGHDVHAFASMLVAVLVGIALGAATHRLLPARARASPALVPVLFALLGTSAVLQVAFLGRAYLASGLDVLAVAPRLSTTRSHELALVLQVAFAALLVVVPAVASGAIFPALCAASSPRGARAGAGAGRHVGAVLAANTAGCIAGSLLVPLALVPLVGLQGSLLLLSGAAVLAGCGMLAAPARRAWRSWAGAAAVLAVFALATTLLPHDLPRQMLARKIGPRHQTIAWYEEGATATVAVVDNRLNGERQLLVNGINEVTTRLVHDQSFKLLGHLGLLLHPAPRRALVICLGAGISGGAAAAHGDLESIDIVDIERSVIRASERFARLNNHLSKDPRVRVVVDDGRSHLRVTDRSYDVIVVDSTHPRAVDSWILYTTEFYATARRRLSAGGAMVQWLPLHGLSVDEFGIIVRTFLHEFPEGSLWVNAGIERYGASAYALLVGPRGHGGIDAGTLARRIEAPGVRQDLAPWGLGSVAEILECFVAGPRALRRWTRHLPENTDDLPLTQFLTRFSRAAPMEAARLLEVREPPWLHLRAPPDADLSAELRRRYAANGFLLAGRLDRAVATCGPGCAKPRMFAREAALGPPYFVALRARYARDPERLVEIGAAQSELGEVRAAVETFERAVRTAPSDARLYLNLGLARRRTGQSREALAALRTAVRLQPRLALARIGLGLALLATDPVRALGHLRVAVELEPALAEAHAALGFGLMRGGGEWTAARGHLERALRLDRRNREARLSLGRLELEVGDSAEAVRTFREGARLHPYDGDFLFNLGVAHARAGDRRAAGRALEEALRVEPGDAEARLALEQLGTPTF